MEDTDIKAILNDRRFGNYDEDLGGLGYQQQEFENEELVEVGADNDDSYGYDDYADDYSDDYSEE